jgi:hypothetical protein
MSLGDTDPVELAYRVTIPGFKKSLYVLGLYNSQCGGCDTLTAGQQISLIHHYASQGHVFYEGLLGSEYYGRLGEASEPYGNRHVFAFLDTPIELCIERVKARRLAKGNAKPLNEENTRNRVRKILMLRQKLITQGRVVVDIHCLNAGEEVFNLFKDGDNA